MLRFWSGHSCDSRGLTKSSRNHCHWGRGIVTRLISRYVWSTARSETLKLSRITINNYGSHLHEYSEWCHGKNFPPSVNLLIPKLYFYLLHSPTQTFNYFYQVEISRNFNRKMNGSQYLLVEITYPSLMAGVLVRGRAFVSLQWVTYGYVVLLSSF